ncbi:MAG: hypothetical protein Q9162_005701, partial [Coniocarpon cinnabarinum]
MSNTPVPRLYVGPLSRDATELRLRQHFEKFDLGRSGFPVQKILRFRTYAFVDLKYPKDIDSALKEMPKRLFNGRHLRVQVARESATAFEQGKHKMENPASAEQSHKRKRDANEAFEAPQQGYGYLGHIGQISGGPEVKRARFESNAPGNARRSRSPEPAPSFRRARTPQTEGPRRLFVGGLLQDNQEEARRFVMWLFARHLVVQVERVFPRKGNKRGFAFVEM